MDPTLEYKEMQDREKLRRDKINEVVSSMVDKDIDELTTYRADMKVWLQILRELKAIRWELENKL